MRRQAVKNRHQNGGAFTETKIREMSGRKSPQKRTISRRAGNARFARTGWWCAQSYTNRSPCYLANIRVIFEKNSERITKIPRSARRPVVFHFLGKFENREK